MSSHSSPPPTRTVRSGTRVLRRGSWHALAALAAFAALAAPAVPAPALASAGVAYDLAVTPIDPSFAAPVSSGAPPLPARVMHYLVQDGKVRIGGTEAKTVYLFMDLTLYVIDNPARVVHVLQHATVNGVLAHYADTVKALNAAAATAPVEEREAALRKAADMKSISERMQEQVAREYRVTVRSESVDGHACRIWEERERDVRRLELCVVPSASLPDGAEILHGMKTLSQFRRGSELAFGVDFGLADWWPDIPHLGGVPVLIREFKFDSLVSEVKVQAIHAEAPAATAWVMPEGYRLQDGPDYAQW